jgi:hypothetical protein
MGYCPCIFSMGNSVSIQGKTDCKCQSLVIFVDEKELFFEMVL